MGVLGRFYQLVLGGFCLLSGIPFVGCDYVNAEVMDRCMHLK